MTRESTSVVVAGSGGAGAITAGSILLRAAARAGYYGLFSRLSGPQVRGGEAAALLRFARGPVEGQPDRFDVFCAIDWNNVDKFAGEIPFTRAGLLLHDPKSGAIPAAIAASQARQIALPLSEIAATVRGGRSNMVAAGFLAGLLGIPLEAAAQASREFLADKGEAAIAASDAAMRAGYERASRNDTEFALPPVVQRGARWLLSGNQALAMGGLRGGVRFVAGYPITPATELVEWMSPALARLGGRLVQGEDELASINLALGASFGGVPSMTVTSGPGLSLMIETIGLAVAAEVPVVVINVMRASPSTGIPTKSEQADLNLAVYGAHGDAPHVVLAPRSIADNLATTQWAAELAAGLQTPVIVLSDQSLGQTQAIIDAPPAAAGGGATVTMAAPPTGGYQRYAMTPSGVSPLALPGVPGCQWVGEGLTHNERGVPSSASRDHVAQIDKRHRKLAQFDFGPRWADIEGEGDLAVIAWGSAVGPAREALAHLAADGINARLIALRVIAPAQPARMSRALDGVRRAIVVEQNHTGQLYRYLRGWCDTVCSLASYARPGPLPLRPAELVERLAAWGTA